MTAASREFLDTNIVVYAFSENPRSEKALALLARGCVISVQVLNEFVNVARRKLGMSWSEIDEALASVRTVCPTVLPIEVDTHSLAVKIAAQHGSAFFDALIVAAALQGGCERLWSEDMHDGSLVDGRLRISNPFRGKQEWTGD